MLRAGINDKDNPLILMGLSEGNIERLKAGHPIKTDIRSYGVDLPGTIAVIYGRTEADLESWMHQHGLVGENTQASSSPRLDHEAAIRRDHPHVLVATVGLPRSGKSTWARTQAYPIVNPDAIRLALHGQKFVMNAEPFVWAIAKVMVRSLFEAGHQTVILDATNTTQKRRDEWKSKEWATYFKVFDTDKAECLRRADAELSPVIERMAASFELLTGDEKLW